MLCIDACFVSWTWLLHVLYAVYCRMFCTMGIAASYVHRKLCTAACFMLMALLLLILNSFHGHCCFVAWALLLYVLHAVDMLYVVYWHALAVGIGTSYIMYDALLWDVGTTITLLYTLAASYVACCLLLLLHILYTVYYHLFVPTTCSTSDVMKYAVASQEVTFCIF